MSAANNENKGADTPGRTGWSQTDSRNSILIEILDAVGDTTVRPIRSPILKQTRPDQPPPPKSEPEKS
jgi:hypothetical protein